MGSVVKSNVEKQTIGIPVLKTAAFEFVPSLAD